MKFNLIDKVEFASSDKLVGVKFVSLAEEYLADHFPTFPVLPGVMMLEALTQAAVWVMHLRRDFACSMAVLKEARNVKYGSFVAPGNYLRVEVELAKENEAGAIFKASGTVAEALPGAGQGGSTPLPATQAVSARIELAYFNLATRRPELAGVDARLIAHHRSRWALIAPANAAVVAIG